MKYIKKTLTILFILLFLKLSIINVDADDRIIFSDFIWLNNEIDKLGYHFFSWDIEWKNVMKKYKLSKDDFSYYKLSYSDNDENVFYPKWQLLWYTDKSDIYKVYEKDLKINFGEWNNYIRLCLIFSKDIEFTICTKETLIIDIKNEEKKYEIWEIKSTLRDYKEALVYLVKNRDLTKYNINNTDLVYISEYLFEKQYIYEEIKNLLYRTQIDLWLEISVNNLLNCKYKSAEKLDELWESLDNSKDEVWDYSLNNKIEEKLNKIDKIIEAESKEEITIEQKEDLTEKNIILQNSIDQKVINFLEETDKEFEIFLEENLIIIRFILKHEVLKKYFWIYSENQIELNKFYEDSKENNFRNLNNFKKYFEIKKDFSENIENIKIKNKEELDKINFKIDNYIDLLKRIPNYWLNYELIEKLENLKTKINSDSDKQNYDNIKENLDVYSEELKSQITSMWDNLQESLVTYNENEVNNMSNQVIWMKEDINNKIERIKTNLENSYLTDIEKKEIENNLWKLEKDKENIQELLRQIEELKIKNEQSEKSDMILWLIIIFFLIITTYLSFRYFKLKFKRKKEEVNQKQEENTKYLQILKNKDEYTIEYSGVYNKWIKVLESTKKSISKSIETFVSSMNKLVKTRWILDDLEKLEIDIPNLEDSWSTIYRLFLPENIRKIFSSQNWSLIIKTDEQEIPWEIMHDWENFISLKYPISRHIMTRESIRKNNKQLNKKAKILFIVNPSWDLEWTEREVEAIINQLWNRADIKLMKWEKVNSLKILSEIWKDCWDIVHYSGHAYFNKENPDESWLLIWNNCVVSATEIKRSLNWNPLIFLNACSSGKSISDDENYNETWEDTIGLASSFIISWAKWVVSTMWPVNDKIAEKFAVNFYKLFIKWNSIWDSILDSKRKSYISNTKNVTWASFIYYWDPNLKIVLKK